MSKSDAVTFGVVSKVYTEKDTRVVKCWEEEEDEEEDEGEEEEEERGGEGDEEQAEGGKTGKKKRAHFGWRHKYETTNTCIPKGYTESFLPGTPSR